MIGIKNMIIPGTLHKDNRGFFQELLRVSEPFSQVSWFSIEPGQHRGHHYHLKTHECFICIEGEALASLGDSDHYEVVSLKQGDTFITRPPQPHGFYSQAGAKLISLSSQHFNPDEPDTYPCNLTKEAIDQFIRTMYPQEI